MFAVLDRAGAAAFLMCALAGAAAVAAVAAAEPVPAPGHAPSCVPWARPAPPTVVPLDEGAQDDDLPAVPTGSPIAGAPGFYYLDQPAARTTPRIDAAAARDASDLTE